MLGFAHWLNLFFNEEEFWEFKKIQYYNKYLNRDTFLNHFNSWNEFENYINELYKVKNDQDIKDDLKELGKRRQDDCNK